MCVQSTDRPTSAALERAYEYYSASGGTQHGNDRYVLLVTDDDPQGPCPNSNTACTDAEGKINELNGIGVTTEVVAIGATGANSICLSELATATGVFPSPYYVAQNPGDLPTDIDNIALSVAETGCKLTLTTPPSGQVVVSFGGTKVPQDPGTTGNGWGYDGTHIFLHGALCTSFVESGSSPNSAFGLQVCDGCCPDHFGGNP
jgi:hypothetical protein